MDAGDIFNRGASIPRIVNLTYEDTGLPINTDDLDEIMFTVLHSVTTRVLGIYKESEGDVIIIDSVNGQVKFIVPKSVTTTAKLGKYNVIAETKQTDGDYEDSVHTRKGAAFCFKLDY